MPSNPPPSGPAGDPAPLEVVPRPLSWLKPYPANARKHSPDQISRLAESIRYFGFTSPILATADGTIVAGHGRTAAAALAGLTEVPVIVLNLSPEDARAYCLADNRLADLAEWDEDLLIQEVAALGESDPELLEVAGWSEAEANLLLTDDVGPSEVPADEIAPPPPPFLCPHCGKAIERE